jgi:hypothetical protein
MAARSDAKLFFPALGGVYEGLADWAYPLLRVTAGLMLLNARLAKVSDRWRCRCRCRACAPRHRTGFAFRLPDHVPGVGRRNLHRNRVPDTAFRAAPADRDACNYIQGTFAKWLGLQRAGRRRRISSDVGNPVPGDPHSWGRPLLG